MTGLMFIRLLPLLLLIGSQEPPRPVAPIGHNDAAMLEHVAVGPLSVPLPPGRQGAILGMPVRVTVSATGEVTDAVPEEQGEWRTDEAALALAAARQLRFRPFHYWGRPVAARGTIRIGYQAAVDWRDRDAAFPPVDLATLRITLTRRTMGGSYTITIDGSGNIVFTSDARPLASEPLQLQYGEVGWFTLVPGEHRGRLAPAALERLVNRFRTAHFFGLRPAYVAQVSHGMHTLVTFETGGRSFTVTDYWGFLVGRPGEGGALSWAIESAVGAERWTQGNAETVPALRAEGFDAGSSDAAQLAVKAMVSWHDTDRLIADLIEAGLPLERRFRLGEDNGGLAPPLGEQLLVLAAQRGRPLTFAALVARGWAARTPRARLSEAFADGGGGCDPAMARAIVAAGADPMGRTRRVRGDARPGATALMVALGSPSPCRDRVQRAWLIGALVQLGVDVNAEDEAGRTVLFGLQEAGWVEQLLALGARASVRDDSGLSPLFFANSERVLLTLLDAGADPAGRAPRASGGRTLRETARRFDMPTLLARLENRAPR